MLTLGFLLAAFLITGVAIASGFYVKKKSVSQSAGCFVIAGLILGTLGGGATTVGTAQLAYVYGLSAMWYTVGSGLALFVLAFSFVNPLRKNGNPTLVGMIRDEYGDTAGYSASILNSLGTFINILSQLISASTVVLVFFPEATVVTTIAVSALFMALYVVFGGTKGAGMVGIVKLFLMYVSMVLCAVVAWRSLGGPAGAWEVLSGFRGPEGTSFLDPFARGFGKDFGSLVSVLLGIITTQTYAQAIFMGRRDKDAKVAALFSGLMMPPLGFCGILVGLYMRSVTDPTVFLAKTALTQFAMTHLSPFFGGLVLGTIFIACVGTGAGLALGVASVLNRDIFARIAARTVARLGSQNVTRMLILAVLVLGCVLASGPLGDMVLNFAYLSMALRGATVFAPLCFLLWARGRVPRRYAVASIIVAPLVDLFFTEIPALTRLLMGFDALFLSIAIALAIMFYGLHVGKKRLHTETHSGELLKRS